MDDQGPDTTYTLEPLKEATAQDWLGSNQDPDVLLSVPNLGIDRIKLVVDNVRAHVQLHAEVLDLVKLDVGADVSIDKVDLEIDNVRVQAMLKVKLDKVAEIVEHVVGLLDKNPDILTNLIHGTPEHARARHQVEQGDDDFQLEQFSRRDLQAIAQAMWREDIPEEDKIAEVRSITEQQPKEPKPPEEPESPKDVDNEGDDS